MIDSHGQDAPNEPEIIQVILVAEARLRVDLEGIVITGTGAGNKAGVSPLSVNSPGCVFKQAVVRIEHLMGQKEEPFPREEK